MARTWITAGTAWAAIVALAWWLADRRFDYCVQHSYSCSNPAAAMASRDNVLIWGSSIALALFVLLALLGQVRIGRLNLRWPTRTPASSRSKSLKGRSPTD